MKVSQRIYLGQVLPLVLLVGSIPGYFFGLKVSGDEFIGLVVWSTTFCAGALVMLFLVRCPHCKKYIGPFGHFNALALLFPLAQCPYCEKGINEGSAT